MADIISSTPLSCLTCWAQTGEQIGAVACTLSGQHRRHVLKVGVIRRPALQDLLVQLDHGLGEGRRQDLEEVRSLAGICVASQETVHNFA